MVRIMAMETTKTAVFFGANGLWVLGYGGGGNRGFRGRRIRKRDFDHGLDTGQLRTSMGGVTNNITQSARLGGWRGSRIGSGGFIFGCPPASFSFLTRSILSMRRVVRQGKRYRNGGRSNGNRLNRCHSNVRFWVAGRGFGWGNKIPYWYAQS